MAHPVFIDGQEGTTGLEIQGRLARRTDVQLLEIPPESRKDPEAKRAVMARAEVVILCLPDAAAVESAGLVDFGRTKVIDASTAFRTNPEWTYGLAELSRAQRDSIRTSRKVSNPGCYPTGMLLAVRPLVDAGILPRDYPLSVHALSGYSGGGKKLIAAFQAHDHSGQSPDWAARPYSLGLSHKHVPEMQVHAGLAEAPAFCPIVGNYYKGMIVSVPLHVRALGKRVHPEDVHALLAERYAGEAFVRVLPLHGGDSVVDGYLSPTGANDTNRVDLIVSGNTERLLLQARLDNLGKGASGAAVQNLNLMLGRDEGEGLA